MPDISEDEETANVYDAVFGLFQGRPARSSKRPGKAERVAESVEARVSRIKGKSSVFRLFYPSMSIHPSPLLPSFSLIVNPCGLRTLLHSCCGLSLSILSYLPPSPIAFNFEIGIDGCE
jgi:hypothetical protein